MHFTFSKTLVEVNGTKRSTGEIYRNNGLDTKSTFHLTLTTHYGRSHVKVVAPSPQNCSF